MSSIANIDSQAPVAVRADSYQNIEKAYTFRSENAIKESLRERIVIALGYDLKDTEQIPLDANLGEGCGNPLSIASLKEGETVVDLGSGGGFDCFLASKQVGPNGRVIGVDMTDGMISLARRNAEKMGATNTEFIYSRIDQIPLPANSVDCVISNCVLNLVPDNDKRAVIREIHRILKPGGRIAVSDYLALKPLPLAMKNDKVLRAGCVSGAMEVDVMNNSLGEAGFDSECQVCSSLVCLLTDADVLLLDTEKDLEVFNDVEGGKFVTPCCAGDSCGPKKTASGRAEVDYNLGEWISAFQIYGRKWNGESQRTLAVVTSVSKAMEATQKQPKAKCCGPKACC